MAANRASRLTRWWLPPGPSLVLLGLAGLAGAACSGTGRAPSEAPDAAATPVGPPADLWEGPPPPIPSRPSPRFVPLPTLVTQRIDKTTAAKRLGELARAAAEEMSHIPNPAVRATQLAALCRSVGPNVVSGLVDELAQKAFDASAKVTQVLRLEDAFEELGRCLLHASDAKRAELLKAVLTRADSAKEASVFTWTLRSSGAALGKLTPAQAEPLIQIAERHLPQVTETFQKEHLLAGLAAAGGALAPERALALLARAEAGVAGPQFAESRPFVLAEIARSWVALVRRHPALLDRAAQALLRLGMTPFGRAEALGALLDMPTFSGAPAALAVLKRLATELDKLPAAEREWLRRRLISRAAQVDGALTLVQGLVTSADPEQAYRAHVVAVRSLAAKQGAEAVRYGQAAVDLLDKLPTEPERNWRQSHLLRALQKVDPQVRQPLLGRLEKRAAAFQNRRFTAWTLLKLLELRKDRGDSEGLRLQGELMRAVAAVSSEADRLRILESIHALGLAAGPAAAEAVLAKAIAMTGTGATASVWWRFIRSVGKQPDAQQKRWLPRLLTILVDLAPSWRAEDLARRARLVARQAPRVMTAPDAEVMLLRVWRAIESASRRSSEVETEHVVNALRAVGVGLASLGSVHFPVLVRRLVARIPRRRVASEQLMSHVTSLGCLLSSADAEGFKKRLEGWVARGTKETQLIRRGAIVAGLVACHGTVDPPLVRAWLAKGPAELSWAPMVQFLIRLPMADLRAKASLLPERRQRIRMYEALIGATTERAKRELVRWRSRRRHRTPARPQAPR